MHRQLKRASLALIAVLIIQAVASGSSAATPKPASISSVASATYDGNNSRTGYATDTSITPANVGGLTQRWRTYVSAPISGQPIVNDGVVYWGDWNGNMHATRLSSGKTLWTTALGRTSKPPGCIYALVTLGIASTATIGTLNGRKVLWVGGGAGQLVALNASDGSIIWRTQLRTEPGDSIWSSPRSTTGASTWG